MPSVEVASTTLAAFFFYDLELWPMTLTFELNLDSIKMNQFSKYLGQKSTTSKVIVETPRHAHIWPNALPGPLKLLIKLADWFTLVKFERQGHRSKFKPQGHRRKNAAKVVDATSSEGISRNSFLTKYTCINNSKFRQWSLILIIFIHHTMVA